MSAADRIETLRELHARVKRTLRLGDPVPAVSTEVAQLVVDLLVELRGTIDELIRREAGS